MTQSLLPTGDPDVIGLVREMIEDLAQPGSDRNLWSALCESELHHLGLPVELGGPGGTTADLLATVFECAQAAAAIPLAENYIAQWSRCEAGLGVGAGTAICARAVKTGTGELRVDDLAWTDYAQEILMQYGNSDGPAVVRSITMWSTDDARDAVDLAGYRVRTIRVSAEHLASAPEVNVQDNSCQEITDLLRATQISGAIRGCYELSRRFASERKQFGVRIDSFAAVQQHLVQLAQAAAITRTSVFRAGAAYDSRVAAAEAIRAAKIVCDRFARDAIRCAHQIHGAIGMTREYHLSNLTRQLHMWRLSDQAPRPDAVPEHPNFLSGVWLEASERVGA